jgi:FAD binding domain/Berberine and berberine like
MSNCTLVGRDDPRYQTLIRGFNLRWVGNPRDVAVCGSTEEIVRVVQRAVDENLRLTVRSGGHCYENFAVHNDGGILVDMAPLNRVGWDDARKAYCIEAGATNWNIYWNLYKQYGKTIPGGSCYSVGAGGHITGGGYGLLSRLRGLVVDWLTGVEVVCVDEQRRAHAIIAERDGEHADLLWAHQGGGGGNFGIVTRFWFRDLPPAPSEAWLVSPAWDWDTLTYNDFHELVQLYGEYFQQNQQPDGLFALLHLTHKAAGAQIVLTIQDVDSDDATLRELHDLARGRLRAPAVAQRHPVGWHFFPLNTLQIQRLPWLYATQTLNGSGPNQRGKYKSAYMKQPFPDKQIETMWKWLTDGFSDFTSALLQVDSYGGQVNQVASDATAVPQRSSILKLQYQTYWVERDKTQPNLDWINGFYNEMYGPDGPQPDAVIDGCYVNYPDSDLKDWAHLYYLGNYPRLQQVKAAYDPHNVFHHDQSIKAAVY